MRILLLLFLCTSVHAQHVDLRLDHQTNAVLQLERAFDGSIWGITGSSINRLPTIAGVYGVVSTNNGKSWTTNLVTEDWWRWGIDVAPISKTEAWVVTYRDDVVDTFDLFHTSNAGASWTLIEPAVMHTSSIVAIHFFSPKVGVAFGTSGRRIERKWTASHTTDGGKSWIASIPIIRGVNESIAQKNGRTSAASDSVFVVALSTKRLVIINRFANSLVAASLPPGNSIHGILVHGSRVDVVSGKPGAYVLLSSTDYKTWTEQPFANVPDAFYGVNTTDEGWHYTQPNGSANAKVHIIDSDGNVSSKSCSGCFAGTVVGGVGYFGTEIIPGKGLYTIPLK